MTKNWVKWTGGKCPVDGELFVEVKLCGGDGIHTDKAKYLYWTRDIPKEDWIVQYRIISD